MTATDVESLKKFEVDSNLCETEDHTQLFFLCHFYFRFYDIVIVIEVIVLTALSDEAFVLHSRCFAFFLRFHNILSGQQSKFGKR